MKRTDPSGQPQFGRPAAAEMKCTVAGQESCGSTLAVRRPRRLAVRMSIQKNEVGSCTP